MSLSRYVWQISIRRLHRSCIQATSKSEASTGTTLGSDEVWDRLYQRTVPRTMDEMSAMLGQRVESPPDSGLLKVAVIGVPNCGKSTLINTLMERKVFSVSSKVHTTQINARAVHNEGATQLVFLDTPGLVTPQEVSNHGLNRTLLREAEISMHEADIMAVVHDISNKYTRHALHPRVLRLLTLYPTTPSVLILNKVDLLKNKQQLLDLTRTLTTGLVGGDCAHLDVKRDAPPDKSKLLAIALSESSSDIPDKCCEAEGTEEVQEGLFGRPRDVKQMNEEDIFKGKIKLTEQEISKFNKGRKGWPKFEEVFMMSALNGSGVDDLRDFLLSSAYKAPWLFGPEVVTDQNPQDIALLTVREKFLDVFKNEIPYKLKFRVEHWDLSEEEVLFITIRVGCRRKGLARFIIGSGGGHVLPIAREAEQDLRNIFRSQVKLRLNVTYEPGLKKGVLAV